MSILARVREWLFSAHTSQWPGCEVRLPGDIELHLVGSVHMGTPDMTPLPGLLLDKLTATRALVVEADILNGKSPFNDTPQCAPLDQRLDKALYREVSRRGEQLNIPLSLLDDKPAWQVALILQMYQARQLGFRPEYGVDYQLLHTARSWQKPVIELEGSDSQLALLLRLPAGGEALLRDALQHWHSNARLLQFMAGWWTGASPVVNAMALPEIFSDELHEVLLRQRNQQWCDALCRLPAGRYVVAVGALHLYGSDNLPALLKRR